MRKNVSIMFKTLIETEICSRLLEVRQPTHYFNSLGSLLYFNSLGRKMLTFCPLNRHKETTLSPQVQKQHFRVPVQKICQKWPRQRAEVASNIPSHAARTARLRHMKLEQHANIKITQYSGALVSRAVVSADRCRQESCAVTQYASRNCLFCCYTSFVRLCDETTGKRKNVCHTCRTAFTALQCLMPSLRWCIRIASSINACFRL